MSPVTQLITWGQEIL